MEKSIEAGGTHTRGFVSKLEVSAGELQGVQVGRGPEKQ